MLLFSQLQILIINILFQDHIKNVNIPFQDQLFFIFLTLEVSNLVS